MGGDEVALPKTVKPEIARAPRLIKDPLHHASRVRVVRIGMGCKADFEANSTAIGKKFNAADRPIPGYHGPRGVMQRFAHGLCGPIAGRCLW